MRVSRVETQMRNLTNQAFKITKCLVCSFRSKCDKPKKAFL
nr:MAG TPA: hypothetical protein [Caudoviricetes sp.]